MKCKRSKYILTAFYPPEHICTATPYFDYGKTGTVRLRHRDKRVSIAYTGMAFMKAINRSKAQCTSVQATTAFGRLFGELPVRCAIDEPGSGVGASGRFERTEALLVPGRKLDLELEEAPIGGSDEETVVEDAAEELVGMYGSPWCFPLGV